jgi:hypothetical protein
MEWKITGSDVRMFIAGMAYGALSMGAVWYGATLVQRASNAQVVYSLAKCDPTGWVTLYFPNDGGQYSCTPTEETPAKKPMVIKPRQSITPLENPKP